MSGWSRTGIAERLGVSRNPVREAIRVLAAEGFVEVTPRRGAAVSRLPSEEAEELFDVRMALEGLTARLSARKVTPASADAAAAASWTPPASPSTRAGSSRSRT